jgi:hypothetical protein
MFNNSIEINFKSDQKIFLTSFVERKNCFDMINILIRKNKRTNCEKCKGLFYPKVDDDGSW